MRLDAVIFGGGAAGLWLLDRLSRDGHHVVLLESRGLGAGETVGSQGILNVGRSIKASGLSSRVTKPLRELPNVWRDALLGRIVPNLTRTRLRSECCYLWQAESSVVPSSRERGVFGAHLNEPHPDDERPAVLTEVTGPVRRVPEQVICPASYLADLADQYRDRLLLIDAERGLQFWMNSPGEVDAIQLTSPTDGRTLELRPRQVIFTAGCDNARLRERVGLSVDALPSRPLHMVLARGNLPELNGHCVEGAANLVTVTSDFDGDGRTVWQIGGRIAKDGMKLDPHAQTERVRAELACILPRLNLKGVEWSTYRLDRVEEEFGNSSRREAIQVFCAGNVTTGCPTKLVLAPVLADEIADRATSPFITTPFDSSPLADWPRPETAPLPWNEADRDWWTLAETPAGQHPLRRAA